MKYLIDDTTLSDIGDAIREKTGTSELIYPDEMGDKILSVGTIAKLLELRGMSAEGLFKSTFREIESFNELHLDGISGIHNTKTMFGQCKAMKHAPFFDTSKVTNAYQMFIQCDALETVPEYDLRAVDGNGIGGFIGSCPNIKEIWIRNICVTISVGSGTSYGHLLTVESLIHLIAELRNMGSLLTLTMGSINLEKLANVYVKTVEVTDEMRAEDDLIDEKVPFVVCESTDEGATLITDYALLLKQWQIK